MHLSFPIRLHIVVQLVSFYENEYETTHIWSEEQAEEMSESDCLPNLTKCGCGSGWMWLDIAVAVVVVEM
jgi:hypothetical protein